MHQQEDPSTATGVGPTAEATNGQRKASRQVEAGVRTVNVAGRLTRPETVIASATAPGLADGRAHVTLM